MTDPLIVGGLVTLAVTVLALLVRVVKAWGDTVIAKLEAQAAALKRNDAITEQAQVAAERAQVAAEQVVDQVDWQQRATAFKAELDMVKRQLSLVEGLPDCQDCRLKIREVLAGKPVDRRRPNSSAKEEPHS